MFRNRHWIPCCEPCTPTTTISPWAEPNFDPALRNPLARLQSALQRPLHLLQRGHGGIEGSAGGGGAAEAVGVRPSVDEQEDAGEAGRRPGLWGHTQSVQPRPNLDLFHFDVGALPVSWTLKAVNTSGKNQINETKKKRPEHQEAL